MALQPLTAIERARLVHHLRRAVQDWADIESSSTCNGESHVRVEDDGTITFEFPVSWHPHTWRGGTVEVFDLKPT